MPLLICLLLLSCASGAPQLYGLLANEWETQDSPICALNPKTGAIGPCSAKVSFDALYTSNACGTGGATSSYACITGSYKENVTVLTPAGISKSYSVGSVNLDIGAYGAGGAACSFDSHTYAVTTAATDDNSDASVITLWIDESPIQMAPVGKDMGVVDWAAASDLNVWFAFGNASVEAHWDRETSPGGYQLVSYQRDGQSASNMTVDLTNVTSWTNCGWDAPSNQMLCLAKLHQANGPLMLLAIDDAIGGYKVTCPSVPGIPDTFYPTASTYNVAASSWVTFGSLQVSGPSSHASFIITSDCTATPINWTFPGGYADIWSMFVLG